MPSLKMQIKNEVLRKKFSRMERIKATFLHEIDGSSEKTLTLKRNDSSWSINELLEHLLIVETGILAFFKKSHPEQSKYTVGMANGIKYPFLRFLMLGPLLRLNVPGRVQELHPKGDVPTTNHIQTWNQTRVEYLDLLSNLSFDPRRSSFPHPVAGNLNTKQVLTFIGDHTIHHTRQVRRIKNSFLTDS